MFQPGSLLGSGSPTKRTSSKSLPDLNSCLINEKKCNPANVQILYSSTKDKTGKDSTTKRACSLDRKETESQVKKMSKVKCSKRGNKPKKIIATVVKMKIINNKIFYFELPLYNVGI